MKGFGSMLTRTLVAARTRLVRITTELSRGMSAISLSTRTGSLLSCSRCWKPGAACAFGPLNSGVSLSWCAPKPSVSDTHVDPDVGAITATSLVTAIEEPDNFKKARSVGAWLGLTTRRYQSGEVD